MVLRVGAAERRLQRVAGRRVVTRIVETRQEVRPESQRPVDRLDLVEPLVDVALLRIRVAWRASRQWSVEIELNPAPKVASDGPTVQPQPHCGTSGSHGQSA